ncbi:substrate-binding domain-containing protein [Grimontia hollisae]|uniref:substrate-binding domain-containing protein n=1 Tax=Grimontia hollisae TaxID=673 RepID=UPI0023DB3476|nr:substrate-binding domain-containing protein [Grimontia hollisae]MDF2185614.1 substrate-binding domain-containing protein [Grimontia hollisae]
MKNKKLIALAISSLFISNLSHAKEINLYGAGGPHHALKEIVENFKKDSKFKDLEININPGPYNTWQACAKGTGKNCTKGKADILWGTSENYSAVLLDEFKDFGFNQHHSKVIFLRPAVILVQKGNPKNIRGIDDLINNLDVSRIVVNNQLLNSVTSSTALWEDIVGRKGNIQDLEKFRSKIVYQAPGSGAAAKVLLGSNGGEKADAWITWPEWYHANQNLVDLVPIEPDRVTYRGINVIVRDDADEETRAFYDYLSSRKAFDVFSKYSAVK